MNIILVGGGETIETIYYLARIFTRKDYSLTIINPDDNETRMLSRSFPATVIRGDGSLPTVLEEAGARKADVVLALTPHDPDNLVACQTSQRFFAVPKTIALVNDPENEDFFKQMGITIVFSPAKILGLLIDERTDFDEISALLTLDLVLSKARRKEEGERANHAAR